jgi:hypothetical protein|tara:strand:- start:580 stop:2790 length:2211 start_codon:yes stop_codon:yes gene_type:complete
MAVKKKINPRFNTEPVASVVAPIQGRPVEQGTPKTSKHSVKVAPIQTMTMAAPAPQPVAEEVVSLESAFDTAEDPFAIEQPTTAPALYSPEWFAQGGFESAPTDPNGLSEYGTEQRPYIEPVDYSTLDPSFIADLGLDDIQLGDMSNFDQEAAFKAHYKDQFEEIGMSIDDVDPEALTDPSKFRATFEPLKTEYLSDQRSSLFDLFKAGDTGAFTEVYNELDPNSKINLLYDVYTDGGLTRDQYLNEAATTLQEDWARQYPDNADNYGYFIKSQKGTEDRLYRYSTGFGPQSAQEVVLFEDQEFRGSNNVNVDDGVLSREELFRRQMGEQNNEQADQTSTWVSMRDTALIPMLKIGTAIATGGLSTALEVAARGIAGETLHAEDWATLGVAGLEAAGVIKPPVDGSSVAGPAGIGPTLPTSGVGIGNLTYNQTAALITGGATGDVETLAVGMLGEAAIDKAFTGVEDGDKLLGVFQADDAKAALQDVVANVAQGAELDDAALSGLLTYAEEGGGFSPDLGSDVDLGIIEDVVKALVEPVQAVASAVGAVIEDVAQVAGDVIEDVAQPVGDVIEDVAQVAGDVVEDVGQVVGDFGSTIDDEIIQPYVRPALQEFDDAVLQPAGDVVEDVAQVTGDVVEDVGQAVGDVAEDLAQAIAELVPDVELPDISTPDIDLPDVNLPDINWQDLFKMFAGGMMSGAATQVVPSPTRTTDDLFGFETEVGLGDIELAQLQRRYLG